MGHEDEYHDAMLAMLELIWGEGFMAPGGEGNVDNLVAGLELRGKRVLDVGSGLGGPAFVLAGKYGATVVGTDLERELVERARGRARELGLDGRIEFRVVEPGPLAFPDECFDVVLSSGAFTQVDDKPGMYAECLRVLRPGGVLTTYDWMKRPGEYSADMRYWFEMEGLTYAMETPERHEELLREAGFADIAVVDRSDWYRRRAQGEYAKMKSDLYPRMLEAMGRKDADHFVENWRAMTVVCARGEMLQVYCRALKPA